MGVGVFSGNGKDGYITAGTNQGNYYGIVSLSGTERDNYPLQMISQQILPAKMAMLAIIHLLKIQK